MIPKDASLTAVAFLVCTALEEVGVTAVLSGGGAAAFHAPSAIQSWDLDFVIEVYATDGDPSAVLEGLGYRLEGQVYRHVANPFLLEFPRGPLAVGGDRIAGAPRPGQPEAHLVHRNFGTRTFEANGAIHPLGESHH